MRSGAYLWPVDIEKMYNGGMTKTQGWVLGVLVVLIVAIGAYFVGTNTSSSIPQSQTSAQTATTSQTTNVRSSVSGDIFAKQQTCSELLTDFQTRWENQFKQESSIQFFESQPGWDWQFSFQDFVIGYSPSLNACVGGFSVVGTSDPCEQQSPNSSTCSNVSYSIINVSTNQQITPNPANEADFQAKLSALTEGQI